MSERPHEDDIVPDSPDDSDEFVNEFRRLFDRPHDNYPVIGQTTSKESFTPLTVDDIDGTIGRETFAMLHEFHWEDHGWSVPIPPIAYVGEYESLVVHEHPDLLRKECCVVV